jgi:hypothetical protein
MVLRSRWLVRGGRRLPPGLAFALAVAAAAGLGIAISYSGRADVGLYYDDYHLVRPWSFIELRRAWLGSWDPTGIEPVFFRPVTAALYATRFQVFALNTTAMHYLSLLGHGLCATLLGWFLRREGASIWLAAFAAWLYAVHPAFPHAQVSWLTNQMHLTQSLVVLGSLLLCQTARDRPAVWWTPLAGLAAVAFLVKEDGVMLLPVLAAMTALRVAILGAKAPRAWLPLLGCAIVLVVGLLAFRQGRLGRLGGYGTPDIHSLIPNYLKGMESAFLLWPTTRIWQAVASVIAAAAVTVSLCVSRWRTGRLPLLLAGVLLVAALMLNVPAAFYSKVSYNIFAWQGLASGVAISVLALGLGAALWNRQRFPLFLIAAGLAVALGFDAPFALVSKREQYHLIALGSVLALAGAAQAICYLSAQPTRRLVCGAVLVASTLPFPLLARHLAGEFLPCAAPVLKADEGAKGWWVVPPEIKEWIDAKAQRCAAGLAPTPIWGLPFVAWDVFPEVERGEDSASYRWTSERPVALFTRDAVSATLAVRRPDASPRNPVRVRIVSSAGTDLLTLDSSGWRTVTVKFNPGLLVSLRRAQRVDLHVEPWFVPAARDPKSGDLRRHGVQLRVDGLR